MDFECINIDDEKDKNYQCNESSVFGINMLFNVDISGGLCFVFQLSYIELFLLILCFFVIFEYEDDVLEREVD